jgi:DNA-binding transcriptional MerR regulator
VRRALSVGFSLAELVRILRVRDAGGAPCKICSCFGDLKLEQIDQQLEELLLMRKHVQELIAVWDKRLYQTPED